MGDLISVIVPVYNVEKYIKKCLDSIIYQTYKNIEIILVDDGSTDNSGIICDVYKERDKRIKVIHKKNNGVSAARNTGIENANGKWISFVDSDDWIDKNYFEILISKIYNNDIDCILCCYNRVVKNNVEKVKYVTEEKNYTSRQYLINSLNPQTGFGFCHMKLIKKECIRELKFDEELKVGEDALFNIKISQHIKKAIFTEKAIYNYRINQDSVVKKYDKDYVQKYISAIRKCKEFIDVEYNNDYEILQNYYNFVAYHVLLIAVNYCFNKNTTKKIDKMKQLYKYKELEEGIKKSNYKNITISRKITLFAIKNKLHFITALICMYRQKTNIK